MKIGFLTFPLNNNYGNLLQAYAMMTILKRMGHDVWLLDIKRTGQSSILQKHWSFIKQLIKKYLLKRKIFSIIPCKNSRYYELNNMIIGQYTNHFIDKYLNPKVSPMYSSAELTYLVENIQFDAFIVGSDQIWRPQFMRNFLKTAYFDFLKDKKVKRIAYAASFGTDEWEYTPQLTHECSVLAKQIDAISVREKSGIALCEKYLGVKAKWVLDPTMLLDKNDYIELMEKTHIKHSGGDMFCYILDKTNEKQEIINTISNNLGLTSFYIDLKTDENNLKNRIMEPVESWLRGFYDAKFVLTDSFHGCVLSLIFNVPLLVY
jgi:hypothetical protein